MARRKTKNVTGITRIPEIGFHDAWVAYICVNCKELNMVCIGKKLLKPEQAYDECKWTCENCDFIHSKESNLPFTNWPKRFLKNDTLPNKRFWKAFFKIATEHKESYWKQCNVCGRVLPFNSFSKHIGWGPLERQMECRSCKGAINAELNPKRTKQQLHESSVRRRIADLLLEGENERININKLFKRFDNKCFKTKMKLDINNRKSWAIDHILPSKYLYPLTKQNAALLSKDANDNKSDKWPSEYYNNGELIELAKLTGANLELLASDEPIINKNIDVNKCVSRVLDVREKSRLLKRITDLKKIIISYNLVDNLSVENKNILDF
ncbi:MAG TPA: hypothetical protein ENG48_07850 [Candidatus Atribacteria bacterium]|nr:hypothetical protein [Candidatus Atribacteria bacterium]